MPITPADIQQKTFSEAKKGYQPAEVDVFLEELSKDVDAMLRKIADLKTRLTAAEAKNAELAQELEAARAEAEAARAAASRPAAAAQPVASGKSDIYTATEEQLSAALIVAQQTADRIVSEAKANAERIRVDAEAQARKVIRQALDEKQTELDEIERLKVSRENFRSEYLALIQKFTDAASANFPLMGSSRPSGSEASVISAPRSATSVIPVESNPYGAQVESAPIDDLD
jgi:cell division initiation protein